MACCLFSVKSIQEAWMGRMYQVAFGYTPLQSVINTKVRQQRICPCHENRLIRTIPMIPHNLCVSFWSGFLYCSLGLAWEGDLKLTDRLWGIIGIVLKRTFLRQGQNLCWLILALIKDWRVVAAYRNLRVFIYNFLCPSCAYDMIKRIWYGKMKVYQAHISEKCALLS